MAYPPPRRSLAPLVLALVALVLAVGVVAVLAAVLLIRPDDPNQAPASAQPMTAGGIVSALEGRGLVDADACAREDGTPPATSQARCQLGDRAELIAIGFADDAGVRARLDGWRAGGTLVQGPNWLVNVADLDGDYQEKVRAALGGTLVNIPG